MPPPSGTMEAEAAMAPETAGADLGSKADETLTMREFIEREKAREGKEVGKGESAEVEHAHGTLEPAVAAVGNTAEQGAEEDDTKALEEHGGLEARQGELKDKASLMGDDDHEGEEHREKVDVKRNADRLLRQT